MEAEGILDYALDIKKIRRGSKLLNLEQYCPISFFSGNGFADCQIKSGNESAADAT